MVPFEKEENRNYSNTFSPTVCASSGFSVESKKTVSVYLRFFSISLLVWKAHLRYISIS